MIVLSDNEIVYEEKLSLEELERIKKLIEDAKKEGFIKVADVIRTEEGKIIVLYDKNGNVKRRILS